MLHENARKFKELLVSDEELRAKLQEAAASFTGNRDDDRDVFEKVVVPFARSAGIELSYDEVRAAQLESRELTDEELELVAEGAGVMWQRIVAEDLRLAGLMVDYDPGWNDFLKAHGKDFQVKPEQYLADLDA